MTSDDQDALPPGQVIADTYAIERFLAHGGMGRVYVARDLHLERRLAVKVLHPGMVGDAEAAARFQREARLLGRIAHPNVVGILGFGRHADSWYLAMELVDGENLDELLTRRGRLGVAEAIGIARQIAAALAEAHALSIVHRDIKPGNVLLRTLASGGLLCKVADFGLARALAESSRDAELSGKSRLLGTPAYMPPEQIQGGAIDGRADVYALAVLVFKMLTGEMPIWRQGTQSLLIAHLIDPPAHLPSLDGIDPIARSRLDEALQRALAKSAADRFESVSAFADALWEAAGGGGEEGAGSPCAVCNHGNPKDAGFCGACGAALPLAACPACAARRNGERWFCVACGTSLRAPSRWLLEDVATARRQPVAAVVVARLTACTGEAAVADAGRFVSLVEREGGRPLSVLGGECVAVFGLGGMRDSELESAVDAAASWLRETRATEGEAAGASSAGVGVSFGELLTRGQGGAFGMQTVLGAPMEAARRAAALAHGDVIADGPAWRELRRRFHGTPLAGPEGPPTAATLASMLPRNLPSGMTAPGDAPIWVRIGAKHEALIERATATDGGRHLVGRDDELADLAAAARNAARRRQPAVVALIGDRGAGRSRLLSEGVRALAEGGWRVLATTCSAFAATPWQPFHDLLRAQLPSAAGRTTLGLQLTALPGLQVDGESRARRHVELLLRLVGGSSERTVDLQKVRPANEADESAAFEAYTAFLRGAIGQGPAVLALDDVDLARPQGVAMLAFAVRALADIPLLVAVTSTREAAGAVLDALPVSASRLSIVDVGPFDPETSREFVRALRDGRPVSHSVAQRLHDFSGGRPALLEEAVEALHDSGVLDPLGADAAAPAVDSLDEALERGLSSLVLDRIGRLPPAERTILEAVALCRDATPHDLLSAMLGRNVGGDELDLLVRRGQLRVVTPARFANQREVALRQAVVAEVLATSLPAARCREMHQRAGEWLLAWRGPRPAGLGALLARHHLGAGDVAAASGFLLKSAQESLRALANQEAYGVLAIAIETARDWYESSAAAEARSVLVEALLLRGDLATRLGALDDAANAAREAESLAPDLGGAAGALAGARAALVRGDVAVRRGEYDSAISAFSAAEVVRSRGASGAGLAALATALHAMVLLRCKDAATTAAFAVSGLQRFAEAAPTPDIENALGRLETVLGHLAARARDREGATTRYLAAQQRFSRGGDRIGAAMSYVSLGNAAFVARDLAAAEEHYREAGQACEAIGYAQGLTAARTNLGNVLLDRGAIEAALVELTAAEQALRRMAAVDLLPETLRLIALCRLRRGNLAGAMSAAAEAVGIARKIGSVRMEEAAVAALDEIEAASLDEPSADTIFAGEDGSAAAIHAAKPALNR